MARRCAHGYSEQIQAHGKIPRKDYARLTEQFNPEKWDPDAVALLAKEAGMRYVVLTAKHHDGFNLFDTEYSGLRRRGRHAVQARHRQGPRRGCARHGLKFGVYFSIIDWNFPYAPPISTTTATPSPPSCKPSSPGSSKS
jgi:alpha-L-fucosidase